MVKLRFVREFGSDAGPHSEGGVASPGLCKRIAPLSRCGAGEQAWALPPLFPDSITIAERSLAKRFHSAPFQ